MLKRPRLPTRKEPQQARARATRTHILTAARRALAEEGPDASMTRIAEIAGYSIGTVYQYFPDRRSLLCELMHQLCEEELLDTLKLVATLREASLPQLLTQTLRFIVRSAGDHRVLTRVLLLEVMPTLAPQEIEDVTPRLAALLAAELERRTDETAVRDPQLSAWLVLTGLEAIVNEAILSQPERFDDPLFVEELVVFVSGYLQRPRQAENPVLATG